MVETPEREIASELQRLIDRFDALIANGAPLAEETAAELNGLAGIYDIRIDGSSDTVWRAVRAVLSRQVDPSELSARPARTDPLTLLVVEDDPDMAADLTALLTDAGHRVVGPFHDAHAAEAATALHAVDLALLDINLSGERDGVDLARSLKDRWGVPILFMSGDVTAAARHADLAEALVVKPFRGAEVVAAIARVAI